MTEITYQKWKNLDGIRLENEWLKVVILPNLGGKVASLYYKKNEFELAAQYPGETYKLPEPGADFSKYDASGLDDIFPSIIKAKAACGEREMLYPDHGEIWSSSFYHKIHGEEVILFYQSKMFSYRYTKRISLVKNQLKLSYEIENESPQPFPCLWVFHGLMRYEKDMELLYPENVRDFENVLDSPELGEAGRHYLPDSTEYNFKKMPDDGKMVKYYVGHKVEKGLCGYRYPSYGIECLLEYDSARLPYLGVWITTGGYRGDYNCALEPANGYYDDVRIAAENNSICMLRKEKPLVFSITITVRDMEKEEK